MIYENTRFLVAAVKNYAGQTCDLFQLPEPMRREEIELVRTRARERYLELTERDRQCPLEDKDFLEDSEKAAFEESYIHFFIWYAKYHWEWESLKICDLTVEL